MDECQSERQLFIRNYQTSIEANSDYRYRFKMTNNKDNFGNNKDVKENRMDTITEQLHMITKERDSLHVLWQTSQKIIETLESELKAYQSDETHLNVSQSNHVIRNLELNLESSIKEYMELEAKFKEVLRLKTALENQLKDKNIDILNYKQREKDFVARLEEMQKEVDDVKMQLAAEHKTNADLKCRLDIFQKELLELSQKEIEAKTKVSEAMGLFDVVSQQKCAAMKQVLSLSKELEETRNALALAKQESMESFNDDLQTIKEKYNEKMADMLTHIRNLDAELVEKGALLAKALSERTGMETQLAVAEERTNILFQDLLTSEKRNSLLVCEKQNLSAELHRKSEEYERECKKRDWEENLVRTQCAEYKLQIDYLQKSLEETHNLVDALQKMLFSKCEFSEKIIATKEEELSELNTLMERQIHLNTKWKKSYVEMATKLKNRLRHLKKQNEALRNKKEAPITSSDSTASVTENGT